MKEKCPNCREAFIKQISDKNVASCPKCQKKFSEKDLEAIRDIEMMNEDMEFWREAQKYR